MRSDCREPKDGGEYHQAGATLVPMQYSGMYMANPGALFAILLIIALPLILLYIFVQRYFIAGLLS